MHVATYPSTMQAYEQLSPGYYDLIMADESHRSIYQRYRRGSQIVDKRLRFLITTLTLLGLVSLSCGPYGPVNRDWPRPQMILDDFDGGRPAGMAWQAPPSVAGSQAHLALASAP